MAKAEQLEKAKQLYFKMFKLRPKIVQVFKLVTAVFCPGIGF